MAKLGLCCPVTFMFAVFGSSYCVVEAPHHTVLTMPGMKAMKAMKATQAMKKAMKAKATASPPAMKAIQFGVIAPRPAITAEELLLLCMRSLKCIQWVANDIHANGIFMKPMKAMKKAMKAKAAAPGTAMKAMKAMQAVKKAMGTKATAPAMKAMKK